jgi:RNA polymerase sigma factor (sigma-70 family)
MNREPKLDTSDSPEKVRRQHLLSEAIRREESHIKRGIRLYLRKLRAVKNTAELEEKVDEVFQNATAQAWRKAGEFDPGSPADKWLLTFAIHEIQNLRRAEQRRLKLVVPVSDTEQARKALKGDKPDELSEDHFYDLIYRPPKQSRWSFEELISSADASDQQILTLHFVEGLEGAELAAALGISVGAAYTRLSRAKNRLRQQFVSEQEHCK